MGPKRTRRRAAVGPSRCPRGSAGAGIQFAPVRGMFRSLNVAASGMAAQETQLDTIANNLANANTTGYKRQAVQFEDLLYENVRSAGPSSNGTTAPTETQLGTGVRVVATTRSFAQGTLQQTNNQLDVAIEGQGFFAVM